MTTTVEMLRKLTTRLPSGRSATVLACVHSITNGIEISAATKFAAYPVKDRLEPAGYDVSHGGYDNRYVKQDPHRLVPLDVARELESEGRIGELHGEFVTTTGLANPVNNSRRLGRGIAKHLKEAGVDAVILTST